MLIHTPSSLSYYSLALRNMDLSQLINDLPVVNMQVNRKGNSGTLSSRPSLSCNSSSNSSSNSSCNLPSYSPNARSPRPHSFPMSSPIPIPQTNRSHSFSEGLGKKEGGTSHYWIGEMKESRGKFTKVKSCNGRKPGFICEACLRGMPFRMKKTQNLELILWITECLKHQPYEGFFPEYTPEHHSSMIQTGKFTPTQNNLTWSPPAKIED